jgi:hypothetical protein
MLGADSAVDRHTDDTVWYVSKNHPCCISELIFSPVAIFVPTNPPLLASLVREAMAINLHAKVNMADELNNDNQPYVIYFILFKWISSIDLVHGTCASV